MTYGESPFWLVCLVGGLVALVLAVALWRFITFNRADNGGIRGDVPENPTPIDQRGEPEPVRSREPARVSPWERGR